MSKKDSILRIWDNHWENNTSAAADVLRARFTKEAFCKIDAFVSDNDDLILEAGCGTGRFCTLLARQHPRATVTGIDHSVQALGMARRVTANSSCNNLFLIRADLFRLPFPDGHFDVVFSEGVIQHFSMDGTPTFRDALTEMVRVTKRGGRIIISVVNWYCFPHTIYKWLLGRLCVPYEYGYEQSFTRKEIVRVFRDQGLHEIQGSGYYPAYTFYRLVRYSRLFQMAGAVTDGLERICDLIRMGWFSRLFGFEIVVMGCKGATSQHEQVA